MSPAPVVHNHTSDFAKSHMAAPRRKAGLAYVEGERIVEAALDGAWNVRSLLLEADFAETAAAAPYRQRAGERRVPVVRLTQRAIDKISDCEAAPPVGVLVEPPAQLIGQLAELPKRLVVLDRLSDPGNVGTLVRSAAAFGFCAVLTDGSVQPLNEKMIRASAGACFLPNALLRGGGAGDLATLLRERGYTTAVLTPRATMSLRDAARSIAGPIALVLGNEAAGIDSGAWPGARGVSIPMRAEVESLNVAMSGAIALYEFAQAFRP
jgi:TrmH family RNA methyltransferase